jgi:hypothetical protein
LTVTRERGHGTVTLPVDYAHEHVRLGYAATEHGYQSDTVDHSISLSSSATTRRGLYVAATRGRHDNLLCVVTDNDDVAQARDVLEGILALDRADVPAVTQRRALAQQTRGHEPDAPATAAATARCLNPDWFEPLRRQALGDLAAAKARNAELAAELERLDGAVAAADRELARVDAATNGQRQRLAYAKTNAERANRERAAAEWRLDHSRLRYRRQARRALAAADNRAVWANHQLDQVLARAAPHDERYNRASATATDAHTALHHHLLDARRDLHTRTTIPELEQRCDALDTWHRWATGATIDANHLGAAVDTLLTATGRDANQYRALGQVVRQSATTIGVDLPTPRPPRLLRQIAGPELGI